MSNFGWICKLPFACIITSYSLYKHSRIQISLLKFWKGPIVKTSTSSQRNLWLYWPTYFRSKTHEFKFQSFSILFCFKLLWVTMWLTVMVSLYFILFLCMSYKIPRNQQEVELRENHPFFDTPLFLVGRETKLRKICEMIVNAKYNYVSTDPETGTKIKSKYKQFQ